MEFKEIKRIAELMKANELSEFEMEDETFRLAIKRGAGEGQPVVIAQPAAPMASMPAAPAAAPAAVAPAAAAAPADDTEGFEKITSPIVGTFYTASSPESPPFIKVGDSVTPDSVVCIVEAMKVMNEIKSEVKGTIKKILVENGSPVEYGEPLFLVEA
jgi:acetyl-CoA carboxylase biotin carboxyl carrier protein